MTKTLTITEVVTSLNEAESRFNICRNDNLEFFSEWQDNLPELTQSEQDTLDRIKTSYLYNSADGSMTEATVNLLLVSPLLYLAGFCDPPYKLKGEKSVEFTVEEREETYRGRIDALVLKNQFWLTLIESKQTKFSFSVAIPQALAYMMANPHSTQPSFGLVTNGDNFLFLKLIQEPVGYYDWSTDFSIFARPQNELYTVLQIMKRIGTLIT
ncbi:MAG: type I restriction enzyme HsdR N-terminal domain-containing protein [Coleofasciculus sp. C2-GNP5-27]